MLTYAVWGLGRKMFTKLRFQSLSKKFWSRWLIKQYAIIVRSRLINIHIRIHYHFSTFSEYCERSTWQFGTNVINQKFWCVSHLFSDLCSDLWSLYLVIFVMLIMQNRLQFWQRNTNMCNINVRSRSKYEISCSKT